MKVSSFGFSFEKMSYKSERAELEQELSTLLEVTLRMEEDFNIFITEYKN